jgi:hypothetical protein
VNASGNAVDPLLVVSWIPEFLRVRTATGQEEPGDAAPAADAGGAKDAKDGKDGKDAKDAKKEEDLGTIRGLELPRGASKPLLVYFHWPHDDGDRGRRIVKFCNGPLDDEAFVRVTPLFHCIEVNTRDSEAKLVEEARVRSTPTMAVCRLDGTVVWRTDGTGFTGAALAETLKRVLREKFAGAWEGVEKAIEGQKAALAESARLAAAGKDREAMEALIPVVDSDVRFTGTWADGVKQFRELEKKVLEKAKAGK